MKDAYILILMDCNHDCLFCSVPKKEIYLTLDQITSKVDQYIKQGFDQITITGGEPTIHPNLLDVVQYIKKRGLSARITTNGTKLTEYLIDKLIAAGLDSISISIHSFNEENSRYISDNPDYDMKHMFYMLQYLIKQKVHFNINITVNKLNYKHIPEMSHIIAKHFKEVDVVNFNYVDVFGNVVEKDLKDKIALRYSLAELELRKAFSILKKAGITFRAERIPLCYLVGFEEYSSDYNRYLAKEELVTNFIDRDESVHIKNKFEKSESCAVCKYNPYCFGLLANYANHFGTDELYPIFHDLTKKEN